MTTSKPKKSKQKPKAGHPPGSAEQRIKLFVEALLSNGENVTKAAIDAGFSPKSAASQGSRLLKNVKVRQELDKRRTAILDKFQITTETTLAHIWGMATADVRELVEYRVGCCRYCHGKGNRYQRTAGEMERALAEHAKMEDAAIEKGKFATAFDTQGGTGYDKRLPPNADCQECFGEGEGRPVFKDTSSITPAAAALYAGVKVTKEGMEIKTHSKIEALEKIAKHLGLYEHDNRQKTDPLAQLLQRITGGNSSTFTPVATDPDHDEE